VTIPERADPYQAATALAAASELVDRGDVGAAIRRLRGVEEAADLTDLARVVGRAAVTAGFDDLASAASEVATDPADPNALYDFGYACLERGVSFLAVPALRAALALAPGRMGVLTELVSALEDESRHAEAVAVLEAHEQLLRPWPDRYLLVFNSVMAGDLDGANRHLGRLPAPEDERWVWAYDRVRGMLARAVIAGPASPLDRHDLRGWHYVLNGGVLATLSPHGADDGMNGRWAFVQDDYGACLRGLQRLRSVLEIAGVGAETVSPLPDRSSRALGLAAAAVLGRPAVDWEPGRTDTVVIAYQLDEVDPAILGELRHRRPGQILVEHATCWTQPPPVTPDVSGLLYQAIVPPWGEALRVQPDGTVGRTEPDDRPAEALAEQIVSADHPGPVATDDEEHLTAFVAAIRPGWPLDVPERDRMRSAGPVPSSRFI
jgi:hypothetical protein